MDDRFLDNIAELDGSYNGTEFEETLSTPVQVTLADINFIKTANQSIWFDGELTFTLTINNVGGEGPITNIVVRDQLDTTMFSYIPTSLSAEINDGTTTTPITDFTSAYNAGLLTITFGDTVTIPVGSLVNISFRGAKVAAP